MELTSRWIGRWVRISVDPPKDEEREDCRVTRGYVHATGDDNSFHEGGIEAWVLAPPAKNERMHGIVVGIVRRCGGAPDGFVIAAEGTRGQAEALHAVVSAKEAGREAWIEM